MEEETEVVVPETTEEVTPEVTPEETIDDVKAKLAKAEEIAENQRIRAEKAEQKIKTVPEKKEEVGTLTSSDLLAIMKAEIHEEDVERVEKFAKDENLTIREAIKNDELKAILSVRTEKRATAQAANVSNVRRGPAKISDEVLVQNASKGLLPDDDAEIERLIAAKAKRN